MAKHYIKGCVHWNISSAMLHNFYNMETETAQYSQRYMRTETGTNFVSLKLTSTYGHQLIYLDQIPASNQNM